MLTCHECNGKVARFFVALTAVTLVFDSLQLIALTTEVKGCHGNAALWIRRIPSLAPSMDGVI